MMIAKVVIFLLSIAKFAASTPCNRTCGEERVSYPFGFSDGCEFRLNCSSEGKMEFKRFGIRNITSESLLLNISTNCSRPIEEIHQLFGETYALASQNALLLRKCSSPLNGCVVQWSLLENRFGPRAECGGLGRRENTSCYALEGAGGLLSFKDVRDTGCKVWYSSMVVDSAESTVGDGSDVTLALRTVQVSWWLNGGCGGCDGNATCVKVPPSGYRCRCNAGFSGDGFAAGHGCHIGPHRYRGRKIAVIGEKNWSYTYKISHSRKKRRSEEKKIFVLNRYSKMNDSSSSSTSDGLSFILDESSDDEQILKYVLDNEKEQRALELVMKLRQLREEKRASSSSTSVRQRKKKRFIKRDCEEAHERLYKDYFVEDSIYNDTHFRRRFRMRRHLFLRILDALQSRFPFFQQRIDGLGRHGLSPLTKCMATIRILAYGLSADCVDEYLKIGESTAMECMKNFAAGVIQVFGEEYLRKPTQADVDRLLAVAEARDFPGMLGSIDCMHWEWKNCPSEWKGTFTKGIYRVPTIILEAVASYDLWI